MGKTVEEPMKKRFKVIIRYPYSIYSVGDIIESPESKMSDVILLGDEWGDACLSDFPEIFKELEWWEDIKEEQKPKYIKPIKAPEYIFRVKIMHDTVVEHYGTDDIRVNYDLLKRFLPATIEDFMAFHGLGDEDMRNDITYPNEI